MNEKCLKRYKRMKELRKATLERVKQTARSKFQYWLCKQHFTLVEKHNIETELRVSTTQTLSMVDLFHANLSTFNKRVQKKHWIDPEKLIDQYLKEFRHEHAEKNRRAARQDSVPQRPVLHQRYA